MSTDNWDFIVSLELSGNATEGQKSILESDLSRWRQSLINRMIDIDRSIAQKRTASFKNNTSRGRAEFEDFKTRALDSKLSIQRKASQLKLRIQDSKKSERFEESEERDNWKDLVLRELQTIRKLMEDL